MFADNVDGSATFPLEIWADPDIDSKQTLNGCESPNPTSNSTIGEQGATDKIYILMHLLLKRDV